jgi:hypothetical protein
MWQFQNHKSKQYFEVESYAAKVGETYVVYFYITIQTKKAYEYYGALYEDSKIMMKMNDGSMISLLTAKSESGKTNYDGGYTNYSTYCILNEDQLKNLKELDIEKTRIYWSKGYEDYDCDNSSLIKNHLNCLD